MYTGWRNRKSFGFYPSVGSPTLPARIGSHHWRTFARDEWAQLRRALKLLAATIWRPQLDTTWPLSPTAGPSRARELHYATDTLCAGPTTLVSVDFAAKRWRGRRAAQLAPFGKPGRLTAKTGNRQTRAHQDWRPKLGRRAHALGRRARAPPQAQGEPQTLVAPGGRRSPAPKWLGGGQKKPNHWAQKVFLTRSLNHADGEDQPKSVYFSALSRLHPRLRLWLARSSPSPAENRVVVMSRRAIGASR